MPKKTRTPKLPMPEPKHLPHSLPLELFFAGVQCFDLQKAHLNRRAFRLELGDHRVRLAFKGRSYKLQFEKHGRRSQVSTGIKTEAGGIEVAVCWLREQMRSTPPRQFRQHRRVSARRTSFSITKPKTKTKE